MPTVVLRRGRGAADRVTGSPNGYPGPTPLAAQFPRFDIAEDTLRYIPNIVSRSLRGLHVTFRDQ